MQNSAPREQILEPELPIVDPHHHLWDWPAALLASLPAAVAEHGFTKVLRHSMRYLLPEFLADLNSGHNIRATVFVQCGAMYRADGAEEFKAGRRDRIRQWYCRDERQRNLRPRSRMRRYRRACRSHGWRGGEPGAGSAREDRGRTLLRGIRHTASFDARFQCTRPLGASRSWALCAKTIFARATRSWRSSSCRSMPGCWNRNCPN